MMCVVTVVLLIWLLLRSLVGYCCACGYCKDGACGYCCAVGVIHTGAKSGGKLVTLFDSYSYDGVSAGIWVIHTGAKSGGEVVTLFDSSSYDG